MHESEYGYQKRCKCSANNCLCSKRGVCNCFKYKGVCRCNKYRNNYTNIDLKNICKIVNGEYDKRDKKSNHGRESKYEPTNCEVDLKAEKEKFNFLKYILDDSLTDISKVYKDNDHSMADDSMVSHMLHTGSKGKRALTNRALYSKYSLIPYIEEELNDHANSIWWENDELENEL